MKEIWESLKYWIIDKLEYRKEDPILEEIHFLRLSLEKERIENKRLTDVIISLSTPKPVQEIKDNDDEVEPIINNKYIPWEVRRRELELKDRRKALDIKREAEQALDKDKSIEQLEKEILEGE